MENEILQENVEIVPEAEPVAEAAAPAEIAEEVPAFEGAQNFAYVAPQEVKPKKSILKKWWFWVLAVIAVLVIVLVIDAAVASGSSSGGSGSSGGSSSSSSSTYTNPYVTIVKTTTNSNYGITYGAAFDSFFVNPTWEYFVATTGQDVVEFEGLFLYDGQTTKATVQFIVDTDAGTLEVYHVSFDGVAQSRTMLIALVQKVFESY